MVPGHLGSCHFRSEGLLERLFSGREGVMYPPHQPSRLASRSLFPVGLWDFFRYMPRDANPMISLSADVIEPFVFLWFDTLYDT